MLAPPKFTCWCFTCYASLVLHQTVLWFLSRMTCAFWPKGFKPWMLHGTTSPCGIVSIHSVVKLQSAVHISDGMDGQHVSTFTISSFARSSLSHLCQRFGFCATDHLKRFANAILLFTRLSLLLSNCFARLEHQYIHLSAVHLRLSS